MAAPAALMLLTSAIGIPSSDAAIAATLSVDFGAEGNTLGIFKTTATLQVVSNPLLDREFVLSNGSRIPNPIHGAAWQSLRQLGADHVRFQPWFPYPHKAVAELEPPKAGQTTSWNFTSMLPQLQDFMANTASQRHPVIWNIGTIPCWLFYGPTTGHCPYPKDPEVSDFGYGERGIRRFFRDQSGKSLAEYLTRVMSYLVNGYMIDENGVVHNGGPAFNFSAKAGHIFEFLNEGEHYYTAKEYVNDYDVAVPSIESALGAIGAPNFMGIGGCQDAHWNWWYMGNCTQWLEEFLDRSKHKDASVPFSYASIHYYATGSNRSNVNTYTKDFFGSADKWLRKMDGHIALRDKLSPDTKLALTELGILLVDDMTKTFSENGDLPDLFFNACAAFMVYVFSHLAIKGVDITCFSQFVGSPPIEKWNIKDMQFPSGTMISWETGLGNAKYWALMLLLQHLHKGDLIQEVKMTTVASRELLAQQFMCEAVGPWTFDNEVTLTCNDPNARIDRIWADMGLPAVGTCGHFEPNRNCTNHVAATAWAAAQCLGRRSCTLQKGGRFQEFLTCPIDSLILKSSQLFAQQLTVQARCTGDKGGHTSAEYRGDSVFSVAFMSPSRKSKKILIINKEAHPLEVKIDVAELATNGATAYIVDPISVSTSAAQGIRQEHWKSQSARNSSTLVTLKPYAVVIAVMNDAVGASQVSQVLV